MQQTQTLIHQTSLPKYTQGASGHQPPNQKQHPHLSCRAHPLNLETVQVLLFRQSTPSILIFCELLLTKVGLFSEHPKDQRFGSLTLSYLLEVTKLSSKISQFKFLVKTVKNIFVYNLFLSLNISDFSFLFFLFFFSFCKVTTCPEKSLPLFSSNLPLKVEVLLGPHF